MIKDEDNILIISHRPRDKDYPDKVNRLLYKIEQKHFWFWGRNKIIETYVNRFLPERKRGTFLEVGCGTGYVLSHLASLGFRMIGVDMRLDSLRMVRSRMKKCLLICADILKDKIPGTYKAIGMFDVLEHIGDDSLFIKYVSRNLKKGGLLLLTVPADMRLWSKIDELSGHKRRYYKKEIVKLLEKQGFQIEKIDYFNFFMIIPQLIFRKYLDQRFTVGNNKPISIFQDSFKMSFITNQLGQLLFYIESLLLDVLSFPAGASIIVAARKK